MGLAVVVGLWVLQFQFPWPPVKALDRFLVMILPATFVVEVAGSLQRIPRALVRCARITLVAVTVPVLLYGSIYLNPPGKWIEWREWAAISLSAAFLAVAWMSMHSLASRSSDISIPISISLVTVAAGLMVMMAGYLKGGAAAFPLAASLIGTAIALQWVSSVARKKRVIDANAQPTLASASAAPVGLGMLGLFGILFVGRFFGGLTTGTALVVLLTPVLCWVGELPRLRNSQPGKIFLLRLALVIIPLGVVLASAKRDFDRDMVPLMMRLFPHDYGTIRDCNV